VRYGLPCRQMALDIQQKLDAFNWTKNTVQPPTTLLLLDRSCDWITPFLHEFTYQAMVQDVLSLEDNRYRYTYVDNSGKSCEKIVVLNDRDNVWVSLKSMHIADVKPILLLEFETFRAQYPTLDLSDIKTKGKDAVQLLKSIPEKQEQLSKLSLHIQLFEKCMEHFKFEQLELIAGLEQDMATQKTGNKKASSSAILKKIIDVLKDGAVSSTNKLRLVALYLISFSQKIKQANKDKLLSFLDDSGKAVIRNLDRVGATTPLKRGGTIALVASLFKRKPAQPQKDGSLQSVDYELSRYVPTVKSLTSSLLKDELSYEEYPTAKPQSTTRENTRNVPTWHQKGITNESALKGSKLIVFVVGGITYSEIRSIYELVQSTKHDIIIGSTAVVSPVEIIDTLTDM